MDEQRAIANSDFDPAVMNSNGKSRTRSAPAKASRKRKAAPRKVSQSLSSQAPVLASSAARDAQRDKISGFRPSFLRKSYNFSKAARGGVGSPSAKPGASPPVVSENGARLHHRQSAASEPPAGGKVHSSAPAQIFQIPDRPVFFTVKESPSFGSRTMETQQKMHGAGTVSDKRVISISDSSDDEAHEESSDSCSSDADGSDSEDGSESESRDNEVRWELGAAAKTPPREAVNNSEGPNGTGSQGELASQGSPASQASSKATNNTNAGLEGTITVSDEKTSGCARSDEETANDKSADFCPEEEDSQAGFIMDEGTGDEEGGFFASDDAGDDEGGGFNDDGDDEGGGFIEEPSKVQQSIEIGSVTGIEEAHSSKAQVEPSSPSGSRNDCELAAASTFRTKPHTCKSDATVEAGNSKDSVVDLPGKATSQDQIAAGSFSEDGAAPLRAIRSSTSSTSRPQERSIRTASEEYDFDFMRRQADFDSDNDDGGSTSEGQGRNVNVSNIMKMTSAIAPWAVDDMQNVLKNVATASSKKRASSSQVNRESSTAQTKRLRLAENHSGALEGHSQASRPQDSGATVSTSSAQELRNRGCVQASASRLHVDFNGA